jgi:hypothetical protein
MKNPRIKTLAKHFTDRARGKNAYKEGPYGRLAAKDRKALERQIKRLLRDDRKAYKRARTNLFYLYAAGYRGGREFPQELLSKLERELKPWETFSSE